MAQFPEEADADLHALAVVARQLDQRPTLAVEEAGRFLGFGRAKSYEEARRFLATGEQGLPCVRFGRSIRVPTAALLRLLAVDDTV